MERIPTIGFVSLGCPKALVDSERIITRLRAEGYRIGSSYREADLVIVNTCGFIDAAVEESLEAIGEALAENGRVIVTGCLGADGERIRERWPGVLAVTGPQATAEVLEAVHRQLPPQHHPHTSLIPPGGIKLTPRHYAYIKIAEGCNQQCSFCIIPRLRGRLVSRPVGEVLEEAQSLVSAGVRELLIVSQDTGAYGVDLKYRTGFWNGRPVKASLTELARALGELGVWVRLHYLYPYPHLDQLLPMMAEGHILPYLDIPLQHASPAILKAMRRPAHSERMLRRIEQWRSICPDITLRSSFITGFPGETEEEFRELLEFLQEAQLDRVGAFAYSPVDGAAANDLPDPVPQELGQERLGRLMELQTRISRARLAARVGHTLTVLIDACDGSGRATGRTEGDAPEIDGRVYIENGAGLSPGELVPVTITAHDEHDLYGRIAARPEGGIRPSNHNREQSGEKP